MCIHTILIILFSLTSCLSLSSQVPNSYEVPPIDPQAKREAEEKWRKESERIEQIRKKKLAKFNKKNNANFALIDNDLGDYWVLTKDEKKGLVEVKSGKTIIPFNYSDIVFQIRKKTFIAYQGQSQTLFDLKGKELIPFQAEQYINTFDYDTTYYFLRVSDSISRTKNGYGRIFNYKGQLITKDEFSYIKVTHQTYLLTEKNKLWGILDSLGHTVFDNQFAEIREMSFYGTTPRKRLDTIFIARKPDNKIGLISLSGKILMPFDYTYLNYAGCNLIGAMRGHYPDVECGFYDLNFKLFIPFSKNQLPSQCQEGLIVDGKGLYGFIDSPGKAKIPLEYEEVRAFENELAVVKKNGKYGIIDKNNHVVLPFMYDGLGFSGGYIDVRLGKKHGVLDANFKTLLPIEFDYVHFLTDFEGTKYFEIEDGEKCFKYNNKGEKTGSCGK